MTYYCVHCGQEFKPEDKVTRCPNSQANSHAIEEHWTPEEREAVARSIQWHLYHKTA